MYIPVSKFLLSPGGRPGAAASSVFFSGARPAGQLWGRARGRSLSLCCDWPNRPYHFALCCGGDHLHHHCRRLHCHCGCRRLLLPRQPAAPGRRRQSWQQPSSPPRPPLWPPPVGPVCGCDLPVSQGMFIWSVSNTECVWVLIWPDRSGSTGGTPINWKSKQTADINTFFCR